MKIFALLNLYNFIVAFSCVGGFAFNSNNISGGKTQITENKIVYERSIPNITCLRMSQVSEAEATRGIDKVVAVLRKDRSAVSELGRLIKVNNVLGYGCPRAQTLAVRFNASFQKNGKGMSSIPLPFGLGQSNESEGRGTMVGQVKATIDMTKGKIIECSVFRDLGYGRAWNLKQ